MKISQWKKLIVVELWISLLFITDMIIMKYRPELDNLTSVVAISLICLASTYALSQLFISIGNIKNEAARKDIEQQ